MAYFKISNVQRNGWAEFVTDCNMLSKRPRALLNALQTISLWVK
jgi:hypothetical protein